MASISLYSSTVRSLCMLSSHLSTTPKRSPITESTNRTKYGPCLLQANLFITHHVWGLGSTFSSQNIQRKTSSQDPHMSCLLHLKHLAPDSLHRWFFSYSSAFIWTIISSKRSSQIIFSKRSSSHGVYWFLTALFNLHLCICFLIPFSIMEMNGMSTSEVPFLTTPLLWLINIYLFSVTLPGVPRWG